MKTKYSQEILLHSLPDYISNNIEDKELVKEIENEINVNPDFKFEYKEIRSTLNFLDNTDFESPNENYFNNLSVKINEKINSEEIPESIWDKLGLIGKIFVPAISIIVIALLIYNFMKNDQTETSLSQNVIENTDSIIKTDIKDNTESLIDSKEDELNIKSNEMINLQRRQKNPVRKNIQIVERSDINRNSEDIALSTENSETYEEYDDEMLSYFMAENNIDNTDAENDEDILFLKEDEDNYEEDLLNFTPEEQNKIIENLNKSQI